MKDEIILYRPDELAEHIEVRLDNETVWLNRNQIATLFGRDVKTIGKHINNVFSEGELVKEVVVAKFATTTQHGAVKGKTQSTQTEHYNLDVIISVGYRVKSKQGTQFRIWATRVLKDYLLKGYAINNRMNRLEDNLENLNKKVNQIDLQINTHLIPTQGVFLDGQVFDAYELTSKIIRSAKKNIILIDNYIDENTLTHLTKKGKEVKVLLLTKNISKSLSQDVQKANAQFGHFELKEFTKSHDRFLIIDSEEVYHLGASLKDLGKKWFAFSKLNKSSIESMLNSILELV
jgi:predicted transcriptional regulator